MHEAAPHLEPARSIRQLGEEPAKMPGATSVDNNVVAAQIHDMREVPDSKPSGESLMNLLRGTLLVRSVFECVVITFVRCHVPVSCPFEDRLSQT
jgi:hypothetical protein